MQSSQQSQPSPKVQHLLQVSRSNANSTHSVDIKVHNIDCYDYCDPTSSENLDNSYSNDSQTYRDSPSPDVSHALFKCALSTTHRPQPGSHHNQICHPTRHLNLLHHYEGPIDLPGLHKHRIHTLCRDDSTKRNYGYVYGRPGFGAGATGTTACSTTKVVLRIRTRRIPRQPLHLRRLHTTELLAQLRPRPTLMRMQAQMR